HPDRGVEQRRPVHLPVRGSIRLARLSCDRGYGQGPPFVEAAPGEGGEGTSAPVGPVWFRAGVREDFQLAIAQGTEQPAVPMNERHRLVELELQRLNVECAVHA